MFIGVMAEIGAERLAANLSALVSATHEYHSDVVISIMVVTETVMCRDRNSLG
jgi:hypothetical protein